MRKLRPAVVAVVTALVTLLGVPGAQAVTMATARQQLDWVVNASTRLPLPDNEIRDHIAPVLLNEAGGPAALDAALAGLGPLTMGTIVTEQPDQIEAIVHAAKDDYLASLHVGQDGLIDTLRFTFDDPVPDSWQALDSSLSGLGTRVSFAASEIGAGGQCRTVHGVNEDVQRPLGSTFKLYVLGALGTAVAEHRASWTEKLAIRDDWKSLPSGVLQNEPAGTELPLSEYADKMISISDNTAADHLIHRLGRDAVQRQLFTFGSRRPAASIPFLTTKALFELKGLQYPARSDAYLALPRWARPAALADLERLPLTGITIWPKPEKIDQLEWFASPTDVCRVFSGLSKENQPEIDHALSINNGGLSLDPARFPTVWYKGGNEPGVLTMNWLLRTADGRTLTTSIMVSDPARNLDETHIEATSEALVKGAVRMMAG